MKKISSQNFPNSHDFRLENSKNIGKFDPEHFMHCVLHSVQVSLKIIKKNFSKFFRLSVCQGMVKHEIPEWIPGIIFDRAIRNLKEPSVNDDTSLKIFLAIHT